MRKKFLAFLLTAAIFFTMPTACVVAADDVSAVKSSNKILLNGQEVVLSAYNINGNNYFKLRDVAFMLMGEEVSFEVEWDNTRNAINIQSGEPYTPVGGEMAISSDTSSKKATLSNSSILLDGDEIQLTAYLIDGNNYFNLRDLGNELQFGVDWDASQNAIKITSGDYGKKATNSVIESQSGSELRQLISEMGKLKRDTSSLKAELLDFGVEPSDLTDFYEVDEMLGSLIPELEKLDAMGYVPEGPDEFEELWEFVGIGNEALAKTTAELATAKLATAEPATAEPATANIGLGAHRSTASVETAHEYSAPKSESSAPSAEQDEQSVYEKIIALKSTYPDGMRWTTDNYYDWSAGIYDRGYGCAGFAFLVSDTAFGKSAPARKHTNFDDIRIGDILRIDNDTHSVVVLDIDGPNITLVEGALNSSIRWGRVLTMQQLKDRGDYVITRY